jgi:exopolysaccharide biosynthesis WecB/TagA/CpsF family protein
MTMQWSGITQGSVRGDSADVVVNVTSLDELLVDLEQRIADGHGFAVATLNLDHVTKLRRHPRFLQAYLNHTHVTADGNPIVWLSRLAGHELSLVPGSELIEPVVGLCARLGIPVGFLGSTDESLTTAVARLGREFPTLEVAYRASPPMGFDPEGAQADNYIDEIGRSGARVCFLALGAPKQEIFADRALSRLQGVGFLSIGAGLDFISGQQTRAPRFVRSMAGEWAWRLMSNPKRLGRRYMECFLVLPSLTGAALRARRANRSRHEVA